MIGEPKAFNVVSIRTDGQMQILAACESESEARKRKTRWATVGLEDLRIVGKDGKEIPHD